MSAFWGSGSAKQTTADTDTAAPAPAAASLSSTLGAAGAAGSSSDAVDQILQSAYNAQYLQASVQLDALEALMDPDNGVCCGRGRGAGACFAIMCSGPTLFVTRSWGDASACVPYSPVPPLGPFGCVPGAKFQVPNHNQALTPLPLLSLVPCVQPCSVET